MGGRRAVAATVVSVLVFGSLVACNYLLVGAEQERMQLSLIADQESAIYSRGTILMGTTLLDVLDRLQSQVSAAPLPCSGISVPLSRIVRGASVSFPWDDGVSANVTARLVEDGIAFDNMTALQPFMGSLPGFLDVEARASVRIDPTGQPVAYSKIETHHIYLPIDIAGAVSLCQYSAGQVGAGLKALGSGVCNSTLLQKVFSDLSSRLSGIASRNGFVLSVSYWTSKSPCMAGFTVQVTQNDVEGPLGPLDWCVRESGDVMS